MNVIGELERFLLSEVAIDLDKNEIGPDEDLLMQGIIDSMGIMQISTFLESKFGIKVTESDLIPDNFRTLNHLDSFVKMKCDIK